VIGSRTRKNSSLKLVCNSYLRDLNNFPSMIKPEEKTPHGHCLQTVISHLLSITLKTRVTILQAMLYGCKIWSLTLKEVFENRVLGKIFGPRTQWYRGLFPWG
jgi:hypothetical protein